MKRTFKKLLLSLIITGAGFNCALAKDYPDLGKSHWAYSPIKILSDEYVIVGYPDSNFKADEPATRAEFATMVIKALHQENAPLAKTFEFTDVPFSHWAYNTIQRAIAFDLIQSSKDGLFRPEDNISKAEAVSIIVSALNTGELSPEKAKQILKDYADVDQIPEWILVSAGKSELLEMTAHAPESGNKFEPEKKITRAEISVNLYNMREQAKLNPNAKLAEAMRPKKGEGFIIDGVIIEGTTATIPKGTKIPVMLTSSINSQTTEIGEVITAKANKNIVSKDKYLLITEGSSINGEVSCVKPARYIIRNGKIVADSKYINTNRGQKTVFSGDIDTKIHRNFFANLVRYIIKGGKVKLQEGKTVYVKLEKPVKIDITNGWILE